MSKNVRTMLLSSALSCILVYVSVLVAAAAVGRLVLYFYHWRITEVFAIVNGGAKLVQKPE